MAVLVRIGKQKAILRGAEWRCACVPLETDLNRFTRGWVQREARSEELSGNLEEAIGEAVVRRFHGKVMIRTSPGKESNKMRYFRLRQLDLFEL